jgi:hypothetical protein
VIIKITPKIVETNYDSRGKEIELIDKTQPVASTSNVETQPITSTSNVETVPVEQAPKPTFSSLLDLIKARRNDNNVIDDSIKEIDIKNKSILEPSNQNNMESSLANEENNVGDDVTKA